MTRPDPAPLADREVLLADIDPALQPLLHEWLGELGLRASAEPAPGAEVALVLVELPYPRHDGGQRLQQLAGTRPGTPILALSPTFHAGVATRGAVAAQLGVAGVLATPVARADLLAEVRRLLERA